MFPLLIEPAPFPSCPAAGPAGAGRAVGTRSLFRSGPLNLAAAWLYLALVTPLSAQSQALTEVLSGQQHPLAVVLRDLTNDWRRITIQNPAVVSGNVSVNISGTSDSATSQNNLTGALGSSRSYVTKGHTVRAAGRVYLVAYHLPSAGIETGAVIQALVTKVPLAAAALTPLSEARLSLLDLDSLGSLDDIRAFDLAAELADSEKAVRALAGLMKSDNGSANKPKAPPAETEDDTDK